MLVIFSKQKTAYDMRLSDWSSDVCSSDLTLAGAGVILGYPDGTFRGGLPIARDQLAAVIVRALRLAEGAPPTDTDHFDDDERSVHEADKNVRASRRRRGRPNETISVVAEA